MRWILVIVALASASCAGRGAPWVPRLALRGRLVRHLDAPSEASAWDWRVDAALFVQSDEPPPAPIGEPPEQAPEAAFTCASPALCAWERSAREVALARMEGER